MRMPRKPKRPDLSHCKVKESSNPRAPFRVWFPTEGAGGKVRRIFKSFAKEDDAWNFAEEKERELANHGVRYGDIPPEARRAYDFYRDESERLISEGVAVPRFEDIVADALADVTRKHKESSEAAVAVCEAVEDFLAYKQSRVGPRQLEDLRGRLGRFSQDFGKRALSSIGAIEIDSWLSDLRSKRNPEGLEEPPFVSPLTRNHYRANLHALYKYATAKSRALCSINPIADLEPEKVQILEPEAYSVEDVQKLMQTALDKMPELVPVVALGVFCGLRVSEASELDLSKIKSANEIKIIGKRDTRRLAPVTAAFRAWFEAQGRRNGKGWQLNRRLLASSMNELHEKAEVSQIDNGLRHTFISYRCAEIRDIARVADECGNSVQVVNKHYRQLVTGEDAERFFALRPEKKAKNVTKIEDGRRTA